MTVSSIRPKVAELTFQLFARSLHPELFQTFKTHTVVRQDYQTRIDITSDGHVITWTSGNVTLTEVAASAHQPLPQRRRILSRSIKGDYSDRIECRGGVNYKYSCQLEHVPAEMFWLIQQQLGQTVREHELIQVFDSSGRIMIGGLSFIHLEARQKSLTIQAIHTFPDDLALVKTQTQFSIV